MTIIIKTEREAYDITKDLKQKTLTAGELAELFADYDPDTPVVLSFDEGYTYGAITYERVTDTELEGIEEE